MKEPEAGMTTQEQARKKQYILIVDDSTRDSFYTGMLLQNFGYHISSVRTGEEAMEFIAIAVPVLVITELHLPGMTGFDLLDRVKRNPPTAAVPVIVQTRRPELESQEHCTRVGCAAYLQKPVQAEELYRAVQAVVEHTPRQHIRISSHVPVIIDGRSDAAEMITVISDHGVFVRTARPRMKGTRHSLTFTVGEKRIHADAIVLYTYQVGEGPGKVPGMGMKFLNLDNQDRAALRAHIEQQVLPPGSMPVQG